MLRLAIYDPDNTSGLPNYTSLAWTSEATPDMAMPIDTPWYITFEFDPAASIKPGTRMFIADGDGNYNTAASVHMSDVDQQGLPGYANMSCRNKSWRSVNPWYSLYFGRIEKVFPNRLVEMPAGIVAELEEPTGGGPDPLVGACVMMESQLENDADEFNISIGFVLNGEEAPIYPEALKISGRLLEEGGKWSLSVDPDDLTASADVDVNISLDGHASTESKLHTSRTLAIDRRGEAKMPAFTLGFSGSVDCKIWNNTLHSINIAGKLIYDEGMLDGYLNVNVKSPLLGLTVAESYQPDSWGTTDL